MFRYVRPGEAWGQGPVDTPEKAREWVRWAADVEVDEFEAEREVDQSKDEPDAAPVRLEPVEP